MNSPRKASRILQVRSANASRKPDSYGFRKCRLDRLRLSQKAQRVDLCRKTTTSSQDIESNRRLCRRGSNWSAIAILAVQNENRPCRTSFDDSKFNDSVQNVKWKDYVRVDSDAVEVAIDDWKKLRWSAGKGV
jgi:hypothetical protein